MNQRSVIFLNAVAFVLGFTLVFSAVGVLLQTIFSGVAYDAVNVLRTAGGTIIILFGIFLLASVKYNIPFFSAEHKIIHAKRFSNSYISSFVFGLAFAAGWTPCIGAILGSIYALAATSPSIGFLLLLSFSLGIGVPFLVAGLFASRISVLLEKFQGFLKYFNIISGIFLIAIGVLIVFNYIGILASFFTTTEGAASPTGQISFFIAFIAGMLTFFSPCILPLLPAFFSYMAGTAATGARKRRKQ